MSKSIVLFFIISTSSHLVCCGDGGLQERITGGTHDFINSHFRSTCIIGSQTLCMANTVSSLWYLTAAHCVPLPGTLGEYVLFPGGRNCWLEGDAYIYPRSIEVVRHPRYVPGRVGGHDLAMVKANKLLSNGFYENQLASIPFRDDFKDCYVYGMGAIIWDATKRGWRGEKFVKFDNTLYYDPPTYMNETKYRPETPVGHRNYGHLNMTARHGTCGHYPTHLQRRILCGNRVRGPKGEPVGVCYGDGGAPLVCNVNGNFYTFGVLSMIAPIKPGLERLPFYNTCGHVDYMDTFMYLCPYYGWIKSIHPTIRLTIPPDGCGAPRHSAANLGLLAALFTLISKILIGT